MENTDDTRKIEAARVPTLDRIIKGFLALNDNKAI